MSIVDQVVARVMPAKDEEELDAIELLKKDHDDVDRLFKDYEELVEGNCSPEDRRLMSTRICGMLAVHAMIEEEIFYPALEGKIEEDLLKEAYVEHDGAKVLINQIEAGGPDEEFYDAKVKVLQEEIEHHVKEEEKERGNMFQQARAAEVDLDALGEQMLARKEELMAQAKAGGLPPAQTTTM